MRARGKINFLQFCLGMIRVGYKLIINPKKFIIMDRKENLEKALRDVFQSQSMTLDQVMTLVARVFNEKYAVNSNLIDVTCLRAKASQRPDVVTPGMFVYNDGTITAEVLPQGKVKGVIGYVEGQKALAVSLGQTSLPWSSDCLNIKALQEISDGQEATFLLIGEAKKQTKQVEAARWCFDACGARVKNSVGFLPTMEELKKLFANRTLINFSLRMLNAPELQGCYWSVNEFDWNYAYGLDFSSFLTVHYIKNLNCRVRSVFWVEL